MRVVSTSLFALAVASLAVSGCSPAKSGAWEPVKRVDPAKFEASVAALKDEKFTFKADGADQIDGVVAALPKWMKVTHEAPTFDAASGATAITNVRISPADNDKIGVQVQQIRLWGFDETLATARLNGQRLDETATLARRIEITGANAFGLETLMNPVMDAYTGAIEDATTEAFEQAGLPDAEPMPTMSLKRYDFGISKIVVDDLVLRPYAMTPVTLPPENEWAESLPMLQQYAAVVRSFAADTVATYGAKAELIFEEAGLEQAILVGVDTTGTKGARGADSDFGFFRGVRFDFNMMVPANEFGGPVADLDLMEQGIEDEALEDPVPPSENATDDVDPVQDEPPRMLRFTGGIEHGTSSQIRLDKLMGFLAKGQVPPRTETDLLSIGEIKTFKEAYALNGYEVYTVADSTVDLSGFHWFIPTKARIASNDATYNIKGILDAVSTIDPDAFAATAAGEPSPEQVIAALTQRGMDKLSFDQDILWQWDAKTGAAQADVGFGLDQFIRLKADFDGGFPAFDAVSALIPEKAEETDQAAMSKLFEEKSTLKSLVLEISDEGGLEKGFGLAVDIAKLMPAGDPSVGFLQSATPQSLRTMASSGLYMVGSQAGAEVPAAKSAIDAVAAFIEKGGKVTFKFAPKEPVLWSSLASAGTDPQATFDRLGYSVTHVAPPAPKPGN